MAHIHEGRPHYHFRPYNVGRWLIWGLFALVLIVAPLIWTSSFTQSMLSQIAIAIVVCLSYNLLLGQGGMLSFGHAVYSGLGSFLAIHSLNLVTAGTLWLPVSLVPMVGGVAGLFFAALLGDVTTKKAGTTFAMITLGVGELVWSMSLMVPEFFGGEGGVSGNRMAGPPFLGITFGPQIQLYYLIAAYCFVSTVVAAWADPAALRDAEREPEDVLAAAPVLAYLYPGRFAEIAAAYSFPFPEDMRR